MRFCPSMHEAGKGAGTLSVRRSRPVLQHPGRPEEVVVDVEDHRLLACVVVRHVPATWSRPAFGLLVERPILGVGARPVAEHAVPDAFRTIRAEHVQVGAGIVEPRTPVFVE